MDIFVGAQTQEEAAAIYNTHQIALKNTQQSDLVTIKDLRSWTRLYKTILMATPQLTDIMDPFDQEVVNKESKEKVQWTPRLI
jgi:hypothetical protein